MREKGKKEDRVRMCKGRWRQGTSVLAAFPSKSKQHAHGEIDIPTGPTLEKPQRMQDEVAVPQPQTSRADNSKPARQIRNKIRVNPVRLLEIVCREMRREEDELQKHEPQHRRRESSENNYAQAALDPSNSSRPSPCKSSSGGGDPGASLADENSRVAAAATQGREGTSPISILMSGTAREGIARHAGGSGKRRVHFEDELGMSPSSVGSAGAGGGSLRRGWAGSALEVGFSSSSRERFYGRRK